MASAIASSAPASRSTLTAVGGGFGPVGGGLGLERDNLRVNAVHAQDDDPGPAATAATMDTISVAV